MFKTNDLVIHFRDGLSKVIGVTKIGDKEYYLLSALRGSGESIYVPIDKTENIIRNIMDEETANKVLKYMYEATIELSPNTKQRRDSFKRRLSSGDPFEMGFLSKQLYLYTYQEALGIVVKFGPADLEMLKYADSVLCDELALVYKVDREKIKDFLKKKFSEIR